MECATAIQDRGTTMNPQKSSNVCIQEDEDG